MEEVFEDEDKRTMTKLTKQANSLKIDDHDVSNWEEIKSAFSEHWHCLSTTAANTPRSGQVILSDLTCNEERVLCGLTNGKFKVIDPKLDDESNISTFKHTGLSCVRCSKVTPEIVYTSSTSDGRILLWDLRKNQNVPAQKFSIGPDSRIGGSVKNGPSSSTTKSCIKPILHFDVSSNDQIICAGTELVNEDSYLLFWDIRSTKLLGAYWQSHSDDVTAVRFHSSQTHSLATGSTDGLINVFNLMESKEDDALIYSLNTDSSVESLHWSSNNSLPSLSSSVIQSLPPSTLTCLTHSNEVQIWDADSGDQYIHFSRRHIADAMMRSNPDAVYVNGCYQTSSNVPSIGLLSCSLSGSCGRFLGISGKTLQPTSLFCDQTAVIQTAQFMSKTKRWITFDANGISRTWSLSEKDEQSHNDNLVVKGDGKHKSKHRLKPYSREKSNKNK